MGGELGDVFLQGVEKVLLTLERDIQDLVLRFKGCLQNVTISSETGDLHLLPGSGVHPVSNLC